MDDWHVAIDGQTFAAENLEMLVAWATEGRFDASAQIFSPATHGWVRADTVPQLRDVFHSKARTTSHMQATKPSTSRTALFGCLAAVVMAVVGLIVLGSVGDAWRPGRGQRQAPEAGQDNPEVRAPSDRAATQVLGEGKPSELELDIFNYGVPPAGAAALIGSTLTNVSDEVVHVGDITFSLPDVDGDGRADGVAKMTAGGVAFKKGASLPLTFQIPTVWQGLRSTSIRDRERKQLATIRQMTVDIRDERGSPLTVRVLWPSSGAADEASEPLTCDEIMSPNQEKPVKDDVVRCRVEQLTNSALNHLNYRARQAQFEIDDKDPMDRRSERIQMRGAFLWDLSPKGVGNWGRYEREHDWSRSDIEDSMREVRARTREAVAAAQPKEMSQYEQRNFEALKRIALEAIDSEVYE